MSEFNLQRARELCAKATAGPWFKNNYRASISQQNPAEKRDVDAWPILLMHPAVSTKEDDKDFIAEARTLLPQACDEVERLRTELGEAINRHNALADSLRDSRAAYNNVRKYADRLYAALQKGQK